MVPPSRTNGCVRPCLAILVVSTRTCGVDLSCIVQIRVFEAKIEALVGLDKLCDKAQRAAENGTLFPGVGRYGSSGLASANEHFGGLN